MALTTFHFFAAVDAAIFAVVLGFDALRVDDAVTGTGRSAVFFRRCRFNSSNAFSHTPFLAIYAHPLEKVKISVR
jgi:hypothetical protein